MFQRPLGVVQWQRRYGMQLFGGRFHDPNGGGGGGGCRVRRLFGLMQQHLPIVGRSDFCVHGGDDGTRRGRRRRRQGGPFAVAVLTTFYFGGTVVVVVTAVLS